MEEVHSSFLGSHNGVSYSTIIIFGAFVFLMIMTLLSYAGRVTEVMRKVSFFSMLLLYAQALLGFIVAFTAPDFGSLEGVGGYFQHFKYALCILICGGAITYVHLYLKKNEVISTKIMVITLASALLFEYVYPWSNIFN